MLAHDRRGSGPPLILIHGLGSRRQVWDRLLAELSRHHEVITLDLPGFGESPLWPATPSVAPTNDRPTPSGPTSDGPTPGGHPAPTDQAELRAAAAPPLQAEPRAAVQPSRDAGKPGAAPDPDHHLPGPAPTPGRSSFRQVVVPGSVDHLADLVTAFLDDLGLDRPELAGSSLGAGVALELGRRGRASAVTAFAPIGFWSPLGRRWCQAVVGGARLASIALAPALPRLLRTRIGRIALCAVFYGRPGELSPEDCLASARALARAPGFAAAHRAFGAWRLPIGADPGALSGIPVTIAWGTRDAVLPHRRQSARARDELPAARHVLLPGCGHLPFADDPARCAELLTVRQ